MIDPLFTVAAQWALGLLLLGAAWHKLRGWREFPAIVSDYRLLPGFLVRPVAMLLVPLENSILYVRPLYVSADANSAPQLQQVIVVSGSAVAMQPTLRAAIQQLYPDSNPETVESRTIRQVGSGTGSATGSDSSTTTTTTATTTSTITRRSAASTAT